MPLYLDGEQLPGFDHRVTALGQIARADLSGETSATTGGRGGWKPWVLQVRLKVRMNHNK